MSQYFIKKRDYRIGIILGAITYWFFGVVDPYMLPDSYSKAWFFRYIILTSGIILSLIFSYTRYYETYHKVLLFFVSFFAQVGIVYMVYYSNPSEPGYFAYFTGLIPTLFWATFLFRFSVIETIFQVLASLILCNLVIIFHQNILDHNLVSIEFAWFLFINFLLISSGVIAVIGSYMIGMYRTKLNEENQKYIGMSEKAAESDMLKSAFLANMSHEIRTPLNSILGFSDLLAEDDLDSELKNNYNKHINNSGNQLLNIIGDILDISKIESNQMKIDIVPVDLNKLLENCLVNGIQYKDSHNKENIEIELIIPDGSNDLVIYTDPYRLTQIIDNLISNAIKNTENGKITFGIHGFYEIENKKMIEFFTKDTGIGIKKENYDQIFERFGRIRDKRVIRGNGIGLCICKSLVEMLGGHICLESEYGVGTIFYFNILFDKVDSGEAINQQNISRADLAFN